MDVSGVENTDPFEEYSEHPRRLPAQGMHPAQLEYRRALLPTTLPSAPLRVRQRPPARGDEAVDGREHLLVVGCLVDLDRPAARRAEPLTQPLHEGAVARCLEVSKEVSNEGFTV